MSSVFREIAIRTESGKSDRLFRAAVSAFTSLTRPSRREIAQLAQLTLPLIDRTSIEARRFACAVLSDSRHAPADLVHRLCEEPVEICAPLLIRSPLLSNADLVRIIGTRGAAHARVIARRGDLHPAIAALVHALVRAAGQDEAARNESVAPPSPAAPGTPAAVRPARPAMPPAAVPAAPAAARGQAAPAATVARPATPAAPPAMPAAAAAPAASVAASAGESPVLGLLDQAGTGSAPGSAASLLPEAVRDAAEAVRRELRAIMAGQRPRRTSTPRSAERLAHEDDYQRLKATLLSGSALAFRDALAQALGIGAETARSIAASRSYDDLIAAFRHIDLSEEEAFLLVCAACPERFSRTSAIRLFLERYRAFPAAAATGIVLAWRTDRLSPRSTPVRAGGQASVHPLPPRGDVRAS
ncbi:DUF2336 domain-containing protein [Aquibium microcysteis]|uniref:DUF2336 domain-containing protein n=1 Tax=Aquibium microcysteis TaxID=675281 RepID=UPI00165CFD9C|nr:DUF2336 domain-containing protein [Aquibium microcysteis]